MSEVKIKKADGTWLTVNAGPPGPGVSVYAQPTAPAAAIEGDIWLDTDAPYEDAHVNNLTVDGNITTTFPYGRFRKTAGQIVSTGSTVFQCSFPIKDEDPYGISSVPGDSFTLGKAGLWLVTTSVAWSPNNTGTRWLGIYTDNTLAPSLQAGQTVPAPPTAGWNQPISVTALIRAVVGTIVLIGFSQTSGADLSTSTSYASTLSMMWMRQ